MGAISVCIVTRLSLLLCGGKVTRPVHVTKLPAHRPVKCQRTGLVQQALRRGAATTQQRQRQGQDRHRVPGRQRLPAPRPQREPEAQAEPEGREEGGGVPELYNIGFGLVAMK